MNSSIYKGLKFIVSIQKHKFVNLQRVIVDLSIRKKKSLIYQGLKFIVSIQKLEYTNLQRSEVDLSIRNKNS